MFAEVPFRMRNRIEVSSAAALQRSDYGFSGRDSMNVCAPQPHYMRKRNMLFFVQDLEIITISEVDNRIRLEYEQT